MNKIAEINGEMLQRAFVSAARNLDANKDYVNALNVFPVPDGDTGTNMYLTLNSAVSAIKTNDTVSEVMKQLSKGALMGARGNSGVILSQILKGMYVGLEGKDTATVEDMTDAFIESRNSAYKAVMKPTEGTILTVVRGVSDYSQEHRMLFEDMISFLAAVIEHGNKVLDQTPDMLKELKEAGVVDAGGKGYMIILEGLLQGLISDEIDYVVSIESFDFFTDKQNHNPEEIKFSYCTEFMINGQMDDPEVFREDIAKYGDSVIVVNDEDITKVHLHTNNPGEILEKALKFGFLSDIKIDNMKIQSAQKAAKAPLEKKEEKKPYGFIVVSAGQGINEIFESMGINKIITGGQTMNPSTEEILAAVEDTNAEDIYIFPNNKNIILSANQVKDLTDKKVHVVGTKQIPEAFTSFLAFNPDLGSEDNLINMVEAIESVDTIQITKAVRDSVNNGMEIKKDDYIGLLDGDIVKTGPSDEKIVLEMVEECIDEDDFLITIYAGEDASVQEYTKLYEELENKYDDLDVELVVGQQPVYKYLISIE